MLIINKNKMLLATDYNRSRQQKITRTLGKGECNPSDT